MGYEVLYIYHPRGEDGKYDTESELTLSRRVGRPFDDTSLEKVAAAILAQLARRDIWVIDVRVDELVKKSISYKETNGGIILKGKKFTLDSAASLAVEDVEIVEEERPKTPTVTQQVGVNQNNVLRRVIYEPEGINLERGKALGYKLTVGSKYPLHSEKNGKFYVTDDSGQIAVIPDSYFIEVTGGLVGDFNDEETPMPNGGGLLYDNIPPDVRGGGIRSKAQIPSQYAHIPIEGHEPNYDANIPQLRRGR